ncbi:hypothetical protein MKW94_019950 [Papaver nudicaule]|uniref:Uncharacterized protein n=1 Tax=Papaver nudicaule TaxID=74823 RepID=A0AA41VR25_PAPNU|nr:hypothetical protein [Papaver nudicaule]
MQGGCIANIGSCNTGFDSASGSVRTKKLRTKGSELANRKGEKNKAMPTATSFRCSSIDETLSLSSRARCKKELILFSLTSCEFLTKFETKEKKRVSLGPPRFETLWLLGRPR